MKLFLIITSFPIIKIRTVNVFLFLVCIDNWCGWLRQCPKGTVCRMSSQIVQLRCQYSFWNNQKRLIVFCFCPSFVYVFSNQTEITLQRFYYCLMSHVWASLRENRASYAPNDFHFGHQVLKKNTFCSYFTFLFISIFKNFWVIVDIFHFFSIFLPNMSVEMFKQSLFLIMFLYLEQKFH